MPFYQSAEQFYDVIRELFTRVMSSQAATDQLAKSNLVIRINTHAPDAQILIDGRGHPVEVLFGETLGGADLELTLDADLLHEIWLSETKLRDAFFSGKIATKGYVFKAIQLTDLFREAERLYPLLLQEKGLR